jgi:putative transposase
MPGFLGRRSFLTLRGICTIYIDPGSPWQNGHVDSFHNRLRDECLNQEIFLSVTEARVVIEEWRRFYNRVHPHSGLGFQSPDAFARTMTQLEPVPRT